MKVMKFDVLEPSQRINHHLFIEASAGTGKTFTIEHMVVRRLLEPLEDGTFISLREIAVITFTNACAMELSLRIKSCITKAMQALDDPLLPQLPYLLKIHAEGKESVGNALKRLRSALYSFSEVTISTIHAFSLRLLSSYEKKTVAPAFTKEVEKSIRDFLAYGQDAKSFFPEQIALLIKSYGSFSEFISAIRKNLWQEEVIAASNGLAASDSYRLLLEEAAAFQMSSDEVSAALMEECDRYKGVKTREGIRADILHKINIFSQLFSGCVKREDVIWNPFIVDEVFSDVKAKAPPSKHALFIERVRSRLLPHIQALTERENLFKRLVKETASYVAGVQDRCNTISIERVLQKVWHIIKNLEAKDERLAHIHTLRGQYKTVIIDEFQDTDPLQWQIISELYLETAPTSILYLVGDPKQSIYRFRGADIYSYLHARGALVEGDVSSLVTNYRSTKRLNEALNTLFAGDHASGLFCLKDTVQPLRAVHLEPGKGDEDGSVEHAALTFCIASGPSGRSGSFPTKELEESSILPFIAKSLGDEIRKGAAKSFAVIVKDRYQAKRVISYLKERGFAAVGLSPSALDEKRSVQCIQRLVSCMKQPRRQGSLSALLMAWPFSQDQEVLKRLGSDEEQALRVRAVYAEHFLHLRRRLEDSGVGSFYNAFLQMLPHVDKDSLYDFEYLFELLGQHDALIHSVDSLDEVLRRIINMSDDDLPPPMYEAENPITVLTMHKSKGLEFDVVFSLGTSNRTVVDENVEEADSEKMRQFYVSLTRAKERLYVFVALDTNEKPPAFGSASPAELYLASVWKYKNENNGPKSVAESVIPGNDSSLYAVITIERLLEAMHYLAEGKKSIAIQMIAQNYVDDKASHIIVGATEDDGAETVSAINNSMNIHYASPLITSFSAMKRSERNDTGRLVVTDETLPQGTYFGRKIHAIIEQLLRESREIVASKECISEWLYRKKLSVSLGRHVEKVSEMLYALFSLRFTADLQSFTLKDVFPENIYVERSFFYQKEGVFTHGVIDCLLIHKNSMYIFDWKTEASLEYGRESLSQIFFERKYDLQASIYENAVGEYLKDQNEITFGGTFFVFLRGLYHHPNPVLYHHRLLNGCIQ